MPEDVLVKCDNVSKKFCRSLKRSLGYGVQDIFAELNPFRGDRVVDGTEHMPELRKDEFWALSDVSFELKRGECIGLIGQNGAGKSTLLKLFNGLMKPNCGRITIKGRIGALIELNAGFNPILSGRENVYIYGAILGFSKKEIDRKYDAIVAFAELSDFMEMPFRSYSSGMKVRLGFAVAAQMDPDVLIIDEVLAVGDVGFRSKCYNAISNLLKDTAIIFVSHSMPIVAKIAQTSLLLNKGKVHYKGATSKAILKYYNLFENELESIRTGNGDAIVNSFSFNTLFRKDKCLIQYGDPLTVSLEVSARKEIVDLVVDVVFRTVSDDVVAQCNNYIEPFRISIEKGQQKRLEITINELTLNPGVYNVAISLMTPNMLAHYDWIRTAMRLEVSGPRIATAGQQFRADWKVA